MGIISRHKTLGLVALLCKLCCKVVPNHRLVLEEIQIVLQETARVLFTFVHISPIVVLKY